MDQTCKIASCKKKLREYRDLTRQQYDDMDSLEKDIRDKDAFAQTTVKARNDLQKEIVLLQRDNKTLLEENNKLLEKVDQLDEDTDTGLQLLRNAHERERKLINEVEEFKKKVIENTDTVSKLEGEKKN